MDITVYPGKLSGQIAAIPSKSQAHRALICAAFSHTPTTIYCREISRDIEATVDCLCALSAEIKRNADGYIVTPAKEIPDTATLDCGECGSTLRFLLPVVAALGVDTTFCLSGRLPQRPLSPLWEVLGGMGCQLTRPTENTVRCQGKLHTGTFTIDGGVSSQFISGLLFAMALLPGKSQLHLTGKTESAPYIQMTRDMLQRFGVTSEDFAICGNFPFRSPGQLPIEGDWSNSAFFLAANTLGSTVSVTGLDNNSPQGDRVITDILKSLTCFTTVDAADIPDLVPILAVKACQKQGACFTNIKRLRLKESNRVKSTAALLNSLGGEVMVTENEMTVTPAVFHGGTVDAMGDHRIAMAAAIAATAATGPVTILGAECVAKSYPGFWEDFRKLGGNYEQHIR